MDWCFAQTQYFSTSIRLLFYFLLTLLLFLSPQIPVGALLRRNISPRPAAAIGISTLSFHSSSTMPFRKAVELEVEPPSVVRYLIGAAIMMLGVVLPVGYMMFRNKRVPSSSSYSKQT
ncbi:hypothetical protein AAHA92_17145 [Salvia divinorum]